MLLKELLNQIDVVHFWGDENAPAVGISCDSRRLHPDFIFAAVQGFKADGHQFLPSAREGGATTVFSERPPSFFPVSGFNWVQVHNVRQAMATAAFALHGRPDLRLPFIGVTGTNGKTTTTYILETIYRRAGRNPAVMGTISYRYGGVEHSASRTTPESPDLAALAAEVDASGGGPMIIEVSSHSLALARVFGIAFASAIFTNLTRDHFDFHRDMDDYFLTKKALFDGRNGAPPKHSIINIDDPWGARLLTEIPGEKFSVGQSATADFQIARYAFDPPGLHLVLHWDGRDYFLAAPLTGNGNLYNVTQAFACAAMQGVDPPVIIEAVAKQPPVPGRLEEVPTGRNFRLFVDFAHSEDSLRNACQILRQITPGRLILVFGCGGDKDKGKRPRMGRVAGEMADVVVLTSDNPRSENPESIIDQIIPGLEEIGKSFIRQPDRREAIAEVLNLARSGDLILLAGKGHETEQIIGSVAYPFNDRETALELLGATRGKQP